MEAYSDLSAPRRLEAAGAATALVAALVAVTVPGLLGIVLVAALGAGGLALCRKAAAVPYRAADVALDALILALFAASRDQSFAVWQLPWRWGHLLSMTRVGVVTMVLIYFAASLALALGGGRILALRERLAIFDSSVAVQPRAQPRQRRHDA